MHQNNDNNKNLNKVKELIQLLETRCQALYDRILDNRTKPKEQKDLGKSQKLTEALNNRDEKNKDYTLNPERVKNDSRRTSRGLREINSAEKTRLLAEKKSLKNEEKPKNDSKHPRLN